MKIFAYQEDENGPDLAVLYVADVRWDAARNVAIVETENDSAHEFGPVEGKIPNATLFELDAHQGQAAALVNYVFHPVNERNEK